MQKHLLHINLIALASAFALSACADKGGVDPIITPPTPDPEPVVVKTPIELSIGGVETSASTRANTDVITNGEGKQLLQTFVNKTKVFMVMKSEYDTADHGNDNYTGSDKDKDKYTLSQGVIAENSSSISYYNADNTRYWDDAHGRSSQMNIWAFAAAWPDNWNECTLQVPNPDYTSEMSPENAYKERKFNTASEKIGWTASEKNSKGAIYPCIMKWNVTNNTSTKKQDANSIVYQDLLFSNNIANNEGSDKRLKFDFDNRKFPQPEDAKLTFYHAMSKITIFVQKGDGFSNDFEFLDGNIKLSNFNTEGTFNIKNGHFEKVTFDEIKQMACETNSTVSDSKPYTYTLQALAIPNINGINGYNDQKSRFDKDSKTTMMEFTIGTASSNSTYKVSAGNLYNALVDNGNAVEHATKVDEGENSYVPLEAGKNYVFIFTVGKKKIDDITAQILDWETVNAINFSPSNAHINLKLEERGEQVTNNADLYRSAETPISADGVDNAVEKYNWSLGFVENKNEYRKENNVWGLTSPWYWPNNITFYHFRAITPAGTEVGTNKNDADENVSDYAKLTSGEEESTYDVCWGAPMLDDADDNTASTTLKWNYSQEYGFDGKKEDVESTPSKHQIYKAIGPTSDQIKLILFHAMSEVNFTITTTKDVDNKVDLGDGTEGNRTKVELEGFYPNGQVLLGNGLVKASGDKTATPVEITHKSTVAENGTSPAKVTYNTYGVVPQDLAGVQLKITTPDNNVYIAPLKGLTIAADKVSSKNINNPYKVDTEGKVSIDRWYPNFRYNYTFTLKKKDVADFTVTVLDWQDIEVDGGDVQIK